MFRSTWDHHQGYPACSYMIYDDDDDDDDKQTGQKISKLLQLSVWSSPGNKLQDIFSFDFMFQINAPFVYYVYQLPLHVSTNTVLIIRRIHCIHTASVSLYVTLLGWPLRFSHLERLRLQDNTAALATRCPRSTGLRGPRFRCSEKGKYVLHLPMSNGTNVAYIFTNK